jgi:hypothetical protein
MNLQDREMELNWREVTCKRAVNGDNFPRGIQDFDFSVSGKNAFIPSLSYFVIDAELVVNSTKVASFVNDVSNVPSAIYAPAILVSAPTEVALAAPVANFRRPAVADGIALADHFGSTLYNNAFFRAGNSDVSLITQYIPQAGVLKSRLDKSFAWSKSIGRLISQDDADFERRRNYVSIDGKFHDDGLKPLQYTRRPLMTQYGVPVADYAAGLTVAYSQATGELTLGGGTALGSANLNTVGVQVDDIIVVRVILEGVTTFRYFQVTQIVITPPLVDDTYDIADAAVWVYSVIEVRGGPNTTIAGAAYGIAVLAAHDPACGSNITQVIFQPPIGIFSEANAISGGDFKISLNPSPNFKINGVQSLRSLTPYNSAQLPGDFDLIIRDVKFYVATIKSDVSPTGTIPLTLVEMAVLNKTMNPSAGSQNLDFTVPPSTLAITVFVQGANAGTTTCIPATKFYFQTDGGDSNIVGTNPNAVNDSLINNIANSIQQIQVTYGSITKTQTLYNSNYSSELGINQNIQRFLQSIQYSGKIVSDGGAECQPQFLERGNYWHFDFHKDKNDTSSYVNVQLGFANNQVTLNGGGIGTGQNLFIVAHYSRQVEIGYENGFITQVVSVNR